MIKKIKRKQLSNALFILALILLLFTPVGFFVKVNLGRLFAQSAAILKTEMQTPLRSYDWQLTSLNGQTFNFEQQKGKVVLINFWATWCPPCVAEMPSLQNLYKDYGGKVEFMFVAQDKLVKVKSFMQKKEYNFPVYFNLTEPPSLLTSKTIPTTYIINKKGEIVVAEVGLANWNSSETRELLDKLLEE